MKCAICGKEISSREANNGEPLVHGMVCSQCNYKVIMVRIKQINGYESNEEEDN